MRSFKNFISEKVEPARGIKPRAGDEAKFMDKHVVDVRDDPHNDKETRDGTKNSPAKKKRIADNDQESAEKVYEANENDDDDDDEDDLDPVNKRALKKKFKNRKDKDIDNDGDVDDSDEYLHNRRKAVSKAMGEDTSDNPANRWHLCAKQVVHETWGEGVCIETQHADPDMDGNIDWYDVMFEHGVETKVSISELKVTKSENHIHSSYKMKKKKMNEMSDAQMKKREEIVKSMKDKTADFKKRYGDNWKSVMYATATKAAMKEETDLGEDYGATQDAAAHAKKDGKNYHGDVSVQHKYDAYHMKKRGYTHFDTGRYGNRRYTKGSTGYGSTKIEPSHHSGVSEEVVVERQKPYVSSDRDGKHVMNGSGKVAKTFKDFDSANAYLKRNYNKLVNEARRGRPPKNASADGGMENIQIQLRKAISMNGQKEVEFHDGSKSKISQGMARAVLGKIDKMRQPRDKQNASRYIAKSLSNLKAFATGKEKGMDPEVERQKILNLKTESKQVAEGSNDSYYAMVDAKDKAKKDGKVWARMGQSEKDRYIDREMRRAGYVKHGSRYVKEEVEVIDEAYRAGIVNLKDGSRMRLASEDAKALNGLYKKLNASNRKQMEQRMMKDKKSFNEIIAFAKETVR